MLRCLRAPLIATILAGCGGGASPFTDAGPPPDAGPSADGAVADHPREKLSPGDGKLSPGDTAGADGPAGQNDAGQTPADAGGESLFAGCPGPEAYAGNPAWRDTLQIAAPAPRLCARWVESDGTLDPDSTTNRLRDTLARKAVATVAPGTYKLIDTTGPAPFALPVCLVRADHVPRATGSGTIARRASSSTFAFDIELPLPGLGVLAATLLPQGP